MGHILRSDNVAITGRVSLGAGECHDAPSTEPTEGGVGRVRVVENHEQYSVIEVVCACGATMHVRCEHG
ncbi:hypothetical protein ACFL6U_15160 [Planctomycetota bacterium]